MKPRRRQIGFTIVELVTSIVIIGILAAAIGPKFIGDHTFSERGYTDELAASLRYAQAVAVANGCGAQVTITATTYQAMQPTNGQPACGGGWNTPITRIDGGTLSGTAPSGVTMNQVVQINFNAQGRTANATVTLRTVPAVLNGRSFTLTVAANSGFVVVQ